MSSKAELERLPAEVRAERDRLMALTMRAPIDIARAALAKCSPAERRLLFREQKLCACADISDFVKRRPAAAVGAFLGGLFGAALAETPLPSESTSIAPRCTCGPLNEALGTHKIGCPKVKV